MKLYFITSIISLSIYLLMILILKTAIINVKTKKPATLKIWLFIVLFIANFIPGINFWCILGLMSHIIANFLVKDYTLRIKCSKLVNFLNKDI